MIDGLNVANVAQAVSRRLSDEQYVISQKDQARDPLAPYFGDEDGTGDSSDCDLNIVRNLRKWICTKINFSTVSSLNALEKTLRKIFQLAPEVLRATGSACIDARDYDPMFRARFHVTGDNIYGKMLMRIRNNLQQQEPEGKETIQKDSCRSGQAKEHVVEESVSAEVRRNCENMGSKALTHVVFDRQNKLSPFAKFGPAKMTVGSHNDIIRYAGHDRRIVNIDDAIKKIGIKTKEDLKTIMKTIMKTVIDPKVLLDTGASHLDASAYDEILHRYVNRHIKNLYGVILMELRKEYGGFGIVIPSLKFLCSTAVKECGIDFMNEPYLPKDLKEFIADT